ncbi:unnamed protein product [Polarella glacialis]|uniref:Uncharacterized protein n=1 Tax=Polarella glacialis TaxID=89957 RepID=A0A813HAY6_POLGL|nr:unnamed protein product [Polarella glacialis]
MAEPRPVSYMMKSELLEELRGYGANVNPAWTQQELRVVTREERLERGLAKAKDGVKLPTKKEDLIKMCTEEGLVIGPKATCATMRLLLRDFLEAQISGSTLINFGKYDGHTYDELKEKQPGYLAWAIKTADENKDCSHSQCPHQLAAQPVPQPAPLPVAVATAASATAPSIAAITAQLQPLTPLPVAVAVTAAAVYAGGLALPALPATAMQLIMEAVRDARTLEHISLADRQWQQQVSPLLRCSKPGCNGRRDKQLRCGHKICVQCWGLSCPCQPALRGDLRALQRLQLHAWQHGPAHLRARPRQRSTYVFRRRAERGYRPENGGQSYSRWIMRPTETRRAPFNSPEVDRAETAAATHVRAPNAHPAVRCWHFRRTTTSAGEPQFSAKVFFVSGNTTTETKTDAVLESLSFDRFESQRPAATEEESVLQIVAQIVAQIAERPDVYSFF